MQLNDILQSSGGLQAIARELNIDEGQAANGAQALAPALLGGFQKQGHGLGGLLGQLGGGGLMDEVIAPQPTNLGRGNNVLAQIFGSKDVSRTVAQDAAARSGLEPSVLQKMLPMLAMLVAGYMSKQHGGGLGGQPGAGGLGALLGGMMRR